MKRLIRGMFGLSLAAGLTACDNDPSLDFGGEPTMVQAAPSVMFINQGATKEILVRLVNDRNQSTPAKFELSNVGSGISVALDENYRPNNIDGYLVVPEIKEQQRYYVTANEPVGTTFTLSSGGLSTTVTVNVLPTTIPIVFQNASGDFIDVFSETFLFDMATEFDFGGLIVTPYSVSADGHTATILAPPAQAGVTPSISGARAGYIPTVPLGTAEGTTGLTTSAGTIGGTSSANAPLIVIPAEGLTFSDKGPIVGPDVLGDGGPLLIYKINVAVDGHYTVTVNWGGANDIDYELYTLNPYATTLYEGTSAHPETGAVDLVAGVDYYLAVVNWGSTVDPDYVTVSFHP